MPELSKDVVADIEMRLRAFLKGAEGYSEPSFLSAGGSAAVFKVNTQHGFRAIKGFDPGLFKSEEGSADKRRLEVQRRLVGHDCASLVQTHRVDEAEGTAFMEMEFVPWPRMTDILPTIPDEAVPSLIMQLVAAVRFLEGLGIVHRDIKPENIHISEDFSLLKLLDLGVAREFEFSKDDGAGVTDTGNQRPFLATAQYSSPEYLFRLDEPSAKLWQGLNFYQTGGVLHDLIMKAPLFQEEMSVNNRWLVARAVLTKKPSFTDAQPERLSQLKALASRCLVKDLDTRLQLVGWDDFVLEGAKNPLTALKGRLAKTKSGNGDGSKEAVSSRLLFDQTEFITRLIDRVRMELIDACGTQLPLTVKAPEPGSPHRLQFILTVADKKIHVECIVDVDWMSGVYCRAAKLSLASRLIHTEVNTALQASEAKAVYEAAIFQGEEETACILSSAIASAAGNALDLIDQANTDDQLKGLHGMAL
jgi:serine/threonine protein kinase